MSDINSLINNILNKVNNKNTKLSLASPNDTENLNKNSIRIYGGLNGWGKWSNYFKVLSKFTKEIENNNYFIHPTDSYFDTGDDIFRLDFHLTPMSDREIILSKKFSNGE